MGRVDLAIGGFPVQLRFNSLGDQLDSKNMSAHSSNFNAFYGGRGRGQGKGGSRGRGRRCTTNNKMRCTTDEDLESKPGFDIFTEGEPHLGWFLTMSSVIYLASTTFPQISTPLYSIRLHKWSRSCACNLNLYLNSLHFQFELAGHFDKSNNYGYQFSFPTITFQSFEYHFLCS